MAKAVKGSFKCPKCDRTFSMAAHLARHMNSVHASKGKKKAAKRKVAERRKSPKVRPGRRPGRPKGMAAQLKLKGMTLEQLTELIAAARAEAQRKMAEISKALK